MSEKNYNFGMKDNGSDELDSEFELIPSKPKRKSRKQQKTMIRILIAAIVLLLIAMGAYFILEQKRISEEQAAIALAEAERLRQEEEAKQLRYEQIMSGASVPEGVTVNGIALGGKTEAEALGALKELIEGHKLQILLTTTHEGTSIPIDLTGVTFTDNAKELIRQAIKEPQKATAEEAIAAADSIAAEGRTYEITFVPTESSVRELAREVASKYDRAGSGVSITNIDKENHTIETSEAAKKITVKQDELYAILMDAIASNSSLTFDLPCTVVENKDVSYISVQFDTSFKGSSSSRIFNIQKGAGLINGTVLAPGETFSTNSTLGTRTLSNGWKEANAYVGGTTEVQAGGGVCQLSSTLYNAAVMADLKIVSRRNHSMPVSYIDKGLDATINSIGNMIDFKFSNNTDNDIVIFSWTEGKNVFFKIYRSAFETDEYDEIRLSAEKIETLYPDGEMEVTLDPTLAPGTEEVDVATQNGAVYQSYKIYYKNGEKVRTEKLALSTYKAFNGSKRVGPDPVYVDPGTGEVVEPVVTDDPGSGQNQTNDPDNPDPVVIYPDDGGGEYDPVYIDG